MEYYENTTFEDFLEKVEDIFELTTFTIYVLEYPQYSWKDRHKLVEETFTSVLSSIVNKTFEKRNERPLLYVYNLENSPNESPKDKKEDGETSSVTSIVTDRSGQDDFKTRTKFRDNNCCVFCGFDSDPLYAAHILPYAKFKTNQTAFAACGICGINDTANGLTLCWNCHQAFDNGLVCIFPDDFTLLVADALQHEESEKWKPLHGKTISFLTHIIANPGKGVLSYRLEEFYTKAKERSENRNEFLYHCTSCNMGCKSLSGLKQHSESQKCSKRIGKMSSYLTPAKNIDITYDEKEY